MRIRTRTVWLLGALALGGVGPVPPASAGSATKVPDEPYPAEFRARVRKAIEAGMKYLCAGQLVEAAGDLASGSGGRYEEAAAVTWVLRRAAVPASEPALAIAAKRLRARAPVTTDEASLVLLALCAPPLTDANPFAPTEASEPKTAPPTVAKEDLAMVDVAVRFILKRQLKSKWGPSSPGREPDKDESGGWGSEGVLPSNPIGTADVQATCMALMGLEAATRSGFAVPAKTFLSALTLVLGWQAPTGREVSLKMNEVRGIERLEWSEPAQARGFGFGGGYSDQPTGYETVAGALALAICQDALQKERGFTKELRQRTRVALRDALAWVQQNYDITKNPSSSKPKAARDVEGPLYLHHWLQGLARLEIHARMRFIGAHDWYQEGAEMLVKTQGQDGAWDAIWWSNCYSLLFLLRSSLPSVAPVVTVSEGG